MQGKVIVEFLVGKDGSISDIKVKQRQSRAGRRGRARHRPDAEVATGRAAWQGSGCALRIAYHLPSAETVVVIRQNYSNVSSI